MTEEKDPMPPTEYRTVDIDGLSCSTGRPFTYLCLARLMW